MEEIQDEGWKEEENKESSPGTWTPKGVQEAGKILDEVLEEVVAFKELMDMTVGEMFGGPGLTNDYFVPIVPQYTTAMTLTNPNQPWD